MSQYDDMADAIKAYADGLPEHTDERKLTVVIRYGNLTFRCRPSREAVLQMAAKVRKGRPARPHSWHSSAPNPDGMRRPGFSQAVVDRLLNEGEPLDAMANATEYAAMYGRRVYVTDKGHPIRKAQVLKEDDRFVIGTVHHRQTVHYARTEYWCVTHIGSGLATVKGCTSKKQALEQFATISRDNLEQAIAKAEPPR